MLDIRPSRRDLCLVGMVTDEPARGERGAIAIQVALFLPILVIIMVGAFEIWRVLYMQQVLNDAAYQGARLLSLQAYHQRKFDASGPPDIPDEVEYLVRRYVSRAPFVDREVMDNFYDDRLRVELNYSHAVGPMCGHSAEVDVYLDWWVGMGAGGPNSRIWMPFLDELGTLHGHAGGQVICERLSDLG